MDVWISHCQDFTNKWGCFLGMYDEDVFLGWNFVLGYFMGIQWGCNGDVKVCVYIYINTASKTCFDCYTGVLIGFNTPLWNSSINNLALTNRQWNLELSENGRFAINLWQLDVANNDQWSTSGWNGALKRISWRLGCGSQVEIASGFGVGDVGWENPMHRLRLSSNMFGKLVVSDLLWMIFLYWKNLRVSEND